MGCIGRRLEQLGYLGKLITFGPPHIEAEPYIAVAGITVELTACKGIKVQCCSGLTSRILVRVGVQHRRKVAYLCIIASTRSPSDTEDAA